MAVGLEARGRVRVGVGIAIAAENYGTSHVVRSTVLVTLLTIASARKLVIVLV